MRRGNAKPCRAARTPTFAHHPRARELSSRALSAKRSTKKTAAKAKLLRRRFQYP